MEAEGAGPAGPGAFATPDGPAELPASVPGARATPAYRVSTWMIPLMYPVP
jgi:hypothetical protein